jgi:arylsulfatase A-like enzyme
MADKKRNILFIMADDIYWSDDGDLMALRE